MSSSSPILFPNVTQIQKNPNSSGAKQEKPVAGEFDQVFKKELDFGRESKPIKFSAHASQRMTERDIQFDDQVLEKIQKAVDKADAKGVNDTLMIVDDAALIVNVKNRTVVTAMDRGSMNGNMFTKIDGAIIV